MAKPEFILNLVTSQRFDVCVALAKEYVSATVLE